jgi:preprotein translocase subunit Sss1
MYSQDTLMSQQNFTKLAQKVGEVEDFKKVLALIGLGGLTMIGVLGYMIFKFNKWGKELIQKRLEAVTTSVKNDFSKVRLAIVSVDGRKRQTLVDDLSNIGFDKEKLSYFAVTNTTAIDTTKNEFIFLDDENNNWQEEQIISIVDTFENQVRFFYYGPKTVSNELFKRLKIAANSKTFLESNFLKAVK